MRENTDHKNSEYRQFSRSAIYDCFTTISEFSKAQVPPYEYRYISIEFGTSLK